LLNRIDITVREANPTPLEEHKKLVDDLVPVYAKHSSLYKEIPYGIPSPYKLSNLQMDPYTAFFQGCKCISVQLEGAGGNMRFTNSEDLPFVNAGMNE
jgi:hypothetical protein